MGTPWQNPGNCKPKNLETYDWPKQYFPLSHPIRVIPRNERELIDYDTGKVIATLNDGYSFFWAHDHLHVCKAGWDGETYPEGWPEKR